MTPRRFKGAIELWLEAARNSRDLHHPRSGFFDCKTSYSQVPCSGRGWQFTGVILHNKLRYFMSVAELVRATVIFIGATLLASCSWAAERNGNWWLTLADRERPIYMI
jgi:hypothetical protein